MSKVVNVGYRIRYKGEERGDNSRIYSFEEAIKIVVSVLITRGHLKEEGGPDEWIKQIKYSLVKVISSEEEIEY